MRCLCDFEVIQCNFDDLFEQIAEHDMMPAESLDMEADSFNILLHG